MPVLVSFAVVVHPPHTPVFVVFRETLASPTKVNDSKKQTIMFYRNFLSLAFLPISD